MSQHYIRAGIVVSAKNEQAEYELRLQTHLASFLCGRELTFSEILVAAGGAFPTDVRNALVALQRKGHLFESGGAYSARVDAAGMKTAPSSNHEVLGSEIRSSGAFEEFEILGDPHPADYDWRFTAVSAERLTLLLARLTGNETPVALLGAPSIYIRLAKKRGAVTLFDRSPSGMADLRKHGLTEGLVEHDLMKPVPLSHRNRYSVVLADPPWYPEFYWAFMSAASDLLRPQGVLFLSVLPWLTRPSAIEDRARILRLAPDFGFDVATVSQNFLAYETPPFEKSSLKKAGLECGNWRTGDLCEFRKVALRSTAAKVSAEDEWLWDEFRFGSIRLKLRRRPDKRSLGLKITSIEIDSPVLSTVSRRSPLRQSIDLWTSDNMAFSVEGISLMREVLEELQDGKDPATIVLDLSKTKKLRTENLESLSNLLGHLSASSLKK